MNQEASAGNCVGHVSCNESMAWQATLTERALELLALPDDGLPRLLLDLGCGSGLSGEELTNRGHTWVVRPLVKAGGSPWCLGQLNQVPRDWPLATGDARWCVPCADRCKFLSLALSAWSVLSIDH